MRRTTAHSTTAEARTGTRPFPPPPPPSYTPLNHGEFDPANHYDSLIDTSEDDGTGFTVLYKTISEATD